MSCFKYLYTQLYSFGNIHEPYCYDIGKEGVRYIWKSHLW